MSRAPGAARHRCIGAAVILLIAVGCSDSGGGKRGVAPPGSATTLAVPGSSARPLGPDGDVTQPDEGILAGSPAPGADPAQVVSIVSASTVVAGKEATAVFQARPGTSCQVELVYPGGDHSRQRLAPELADGAGRISWTWRVPAGIGKGTATASVSCSGHSRGEAALPVR